MSRWFDPSAPLPPSARAAPVERVYVRIFGAHAQVLARHQRRRVLGDAEFAPDYAPALADQVPNRWRSRQ